MCSPCGSSSRLLAALLIGRGIRLADRRSPGTGVALTTADLPTSFVPAPAPVRRRAVPLPRVGIALAALAVALETVGYVLRLDGATGRAAQLFSMDAPLALPRMFVAAAVRRRRARGRRRRRPLPGRRAWWLAVGARRRWHRRGQGRRHRARPSDGRADRRRRRYGRGLWSASLAAVAAVAALWFLSRSERRDRRRVLGALVGYAVAAVGLSAVSAAVPPSPLRDRDASSRSPARRWPASAFLVAVLVGVAPRLVLPADWALRRTADAHTLDLPDAVPGRVGERGTARRLTPSPRDCAQRGTSGRASSLNSAAFARSESLRR